MIEGDFSTSTLKFNGSISDGLSVDGSIFKKTTVTTISTAGAVTYTAAQLIGGLILRDTGDAARQDVTPTAAQIVAAITNAFVGASFEFMIIQTGDHNSDAATLTGGSGVTIPNAYASGNALNVEKNAIGRYLAVATNVTSGSEAVTIYVMSISQS